MSATPVVTFEPKYLAAFVQLNREWIEHYFKLEPMDLSQLENPRASILDKGGEIFFLLENEVPIGTCALIPNGERSFELAKMAVSKEQRGKGHADVLMRAIVEWARAKGARQITLLSNTKLEPAITLYKKHGFKMLHCGTHPDYSRCNIEMALALE